MSGASGAARIRAATPADAEALLRIYAPVVRTSPSDRSTG
jgi:hypothetical protein